MRKQMILLIAAGITFSCSSDDAMENCEQEVTGMNRTCENEDCTYTLTYGPDEVNTKTIPVNKATYDFYVSVIDDDDPMDCWVGLK